MPGDIVYPLVRPLTHEQIIKLEYMKQVGICTSFYVKDEIMADVEMPVPKEDLREALDEYSRRYLADKLRQMTDDLKG